MTPDYHHIGFSGLEVANPVTMDRIAAFAARPGLPVGALVLDIGAGSGGVAAALAERFGFRVHAIEADPVMAAMIHDRIESRRLADRLTVTAASSGDVLSDLAKPADMIVALGATAAAGEDAKTALQLFSGLSRSLASPAYLIWGSLTWTRPPPEDLLRLMAQSGQFASDLGWRTAAGKAGFDCLQAEMSPQSVWDAFFDGVDARVRAFAAANPEAEGVDDLIQRADQVRAAIASARSYMAFGLYLFGKP